eukprot:1938590-Amphidinium_carterae.1
MGQYHDGDVRCNLPEGRCRGCISQAAAAGILQALIIPIPEETQKSLNTVQEARDTLEVTPNILRNSRDGVAYYNPDGYQFFKAYHPVRGEAAVHLTHKETIGICTPAPILLI